MRILTGLIVVLTIALLAAVTFAADKAVHPPCTCGPRCPTPAAKPWPIPASMEKLR